MLGRAALQGEVDHDLVEQLRGDPLRRNSVDWQQAEIARRWGDWHAPPPVVQRRRRRMADEGWRPLVFDTDAQFQGTLWRLYTDGAVRGPRMGYAALLTLGREVPFRVRGAVQRSPSGQRYWGVFGASSGVAELCLAGFCVRA